MNIKDDPEAMKALRYLRSKGYTAKHVVDSYKRLLASLPTPPNGARE